ncbi:MAG TPA: HPr kinase/phosphatase C-terminal domain-containing protein [Pseudolabrys sp.]
MAADAATIHASAVLVGRKAALIRGPAGSGKSQLVWDLLQGATPFARLVADDRAHVEARGGRLLVGPAPALAGLIEIRGLGILRVAYEPLAVVGLVVELADDDAVRHPDPKVQQTVIEGVSLPRVAIGAGMSALPTVLAFLKGSQTSN